MGYCTNMHTYTIMLDLGQYSSILLKLPITLYFIHMLIIYIALGMHSDKFMITNFNIKNTDALIV